MGAGQTKSASRTNQQRRVLDKTKTGNGYMRKEGYAAHRRSTGQKYHGPGGARQQQEEEYYNRKPDQQPRQRREDYNDYNKNKEKMKVSEGEKRMMRSGSSIDEEEMVDGWPKWLIENVPKEVLAGLVPKSAEAYEKIDKVGEGTYSNVYKARDRKTGRIVALKKVRFDTSEPESVKFMAREIMILRKLDHPNVVKLEGLATSRMHYSLYLVFDYMKSDLSRVICRPEGLTEPQVKCYMHQLLLGLQHCHERGILHRDIKGSNLLIDKDGMLKIADFGLANYYFPNKRHPLTSRVVTLWYRAPELLLGSTDYGVGIDLWSAGCLLAEMFAGRPIMPGRTEVEQLHRIFKLCGTPTEEYWKRLKLSSTFRPPHAYKSCLFQTFRDFPESSLGLLSTLLALDPATRGSAALALEDDFFTTRPLGCELSGLPVIPTEDNDPVQANDQRRQRKIRQRSKTIREHRRKDRETEIEKQEITSPKQESQQTDEPNVGVQVQEEPGSTGSTSPVTKMIDRAGSSHDHPDVVMDIPPLPSSRPRIAKYIINNNDIKNAADNKYRVSKVQRSASSKDFRSSEPQKHI